MLAVLALIALMLAWLLFRQSGRQRKAAGLPGGRLIYADTSRWQPVEEPLYDAGLGLTGKPDYLIESGEQIIPVEVKSGPAPQGPYDAHIFQLAAYCALVERVYHVRPAHGILHYAGSQAAAQTYTIEYTPELEIALLEVLDEMRSQEKSRDVPRSHIVLNRCRGCGYRQVCDQRLG
jgi:CRISPR-associated exonuclease Cas4